MQQLGKVLTQTTWSKASDTINNNSDKIYEAVTQVENATIRNKGYFLSSSELKQAYPSPIAGMTAFVYNQDNDQTYPYDIYQSYYDEKNGVWSWKDSGNDAPFPEVDINSINEDIKRLEANDTENANQIQLLQDEIEDLPSIREELNTLVVNDLTTGGANKALSAEMGKALSAELTELESEVKFCTDSVLSQYITFMHIQNRENAINNGLYIAFVDYEYGDIYIGDNSAEYYSIGRMKVSEDGRYKFIETESDSYGSIYIELLLGDGVRHRAEKFSFNLGDVAFSKIEYNNKKRTEKNSSDIKSEESRAKDVENNISKDIEKVESKLNGYIFDDSSDNVDFADQDGNVVLRLSKEGLSFKQATTKDEEGFVIADALGNVAFEVGKDGVKFKAKTIYLKKEIYQASSTMRGMKLLAIGDSITAGGQWANRVGELLGMDVKLHARGGAKIVDMVDGQGAESGSPVDPDTNVSGVLLPLNASDVADVDIIIAHGFYNNRPLPNAEVVGEVTDMYPTQISICGKLNYLIKRIYDCLKEANNTKCIVCLSSPHCYGKYPYNGNTAYDDGSVMANTIKSICEHNFVTYIDCMHNANINKHNWSIYQASSTAVNENYLPSYGENDATNRPFDTISSDNKQLVKDSFVAHASNYNGFCATIEGKELYGGAQVSSYYESNGDEWVLKRNNGVDGVGTPWCKDQLHLSEQGYERLGNCISNYIKNL